MNISEIDVFKNAAQEPKFVSFSDVQKTLYKVWSGFTKFIRNNIHKGLNVNCDFGRFISSDLKGVIYIPSAKFLSQGNFDYKSLDLLSTESRDKRLDQHISYSAIGYVCGLDRDQVQKSIQEIIHQLILLVSLGKKISLDFKIGELRLSRNNVEWKHSKGTMRLNRTLDVESTRDSSVATPRSSKCTEFKYGSLSVHPSNPNPIHQGPTKNLNNYYRGVSYNLEKTVPLPVAFYTGKLHPLFDFRTKFTRRQACDLAISPQELLNSHNEQMRQKAQKQIDLKLKAKEEEQRLMQHINNQLRKENDNKEYSENVKKAIFLQENLNQLERKRSKKQKIKHEKLNETYDYFPFTHGDQVEAQQRKLNETLKEDLRKHLGSLNSTMEALSISPRSPKKQLEVPRFLLPAEHASLNQTRDRELAMSSALDRYQQELLDKERELQRKIEEKHKQEEIEKFIFVTKEIKHKKKLHRYKQALQAQIEENLIKKDKEKTENASPVRTNFGPEESREDMQNETSFKLNREKELKEFLINQMNDRLEKKRFYEEDERYEDCLINDNVQLVLCQEDDKYKEKRRKEKQLNKATWQKQMKLKELEKSMIN